ncbi:hypothetical protein DFJ58DRAFT_915066, partial [Suillus subalutaceus]|uniref:uncharacterized protein n=1 Tax=Suillus subalutaceus TaxID=48586 RepID=UPI001B85E2BF
MDGSCLVRQIGGKQMINEQVAAFPIDQDTATFKFGRDPTCSARLCYTEVSALHAEIVFLKDRNKSCALAGFQSSSPLAKHASQQTVVEGVK